MRSSIILVYIGCFWANWPTLSKVAKALKPPEPLNYNGFRFEVNPSFKAVTLPLCDLKDCFELILKIAFSAAKTLTVGGF